MGRDFIEESKGIWPVLLRLVRDAACTKKVVHADLVLRIGAGRDEKRRIRFRSEYVYDHEPGRLDRLQVHGNKIKARPAQGTRAILA